MLSSEISEILNLIYYLSPFFTLIFGTIVISFLIIWKKLK